VFSKVKTELLNLILAKYVLPTIIFIETIISDYQLG
jgi:hypothetical protein